MTHTINMVRWSRVGLFCVLFFGLCSLSLRAQTKNRVYQDYVRKYADECIKQMNQHDVPASITMAQGLLESGAGRSTLASVHNNHFGIKCHKAWQGKRTYRDDDAKGECFRSYESDIASFTDHSYFLKQPRYQSLYKLSKTDYIGWAKGLQRAGYATDKGYANKLIALIELYELYELDRKAYPAWMNTSYKPIKETRKKKKTKTSKPLRQGYISYDLLYVLAEEGDTFTSIAEDMEMKPQELADYNDAPLDFPLHKGEAVYLQRKNKQATIAYQDHIVAVGESIHSIAQKYGIRVKYLYLINNLDPETYVPEEGDVLQLR